LWCHKSLYPVVHLTFTWCIILLTSSMKQCPSWEANLFSASQEIPCILWNQEVHYRIHKCAPPVHILNQIDPVCTPTSHFLKILLSIFLPYTPGFSKWSLSAGCTTKTLYTTLLSPISATCPSHLTILHLITWTLLGDEYVSLSKSLSSFLHSPATLSLLGPNILISTLFSNILSLRSSLSLSKQVSHTYKATSTIKFCIS